MHNYNTQQTYIDITWIWGSCDSCTVFILGNSVLEIRAKTCTYGMLAIYLNMKSEYDTLYLSTNVLIKQKHIVPNTSSWESAWGLWTECTGCKPAMKTVLVDDWFRCLNTSRQSSQCMSQIPIKISSTYIFFLFLGEKTKSSHSGFLAEWKRHTECVCWHL